MRLNGNLVHVMYSDDGQGNEDDADYKAVPRCCLAHEYLEGEGAQSPLDTCLGVGLE